MTIGEIRKQLGTNTGDCLRVNLTVEDDGLLGEIEIKGNLRTFAFLIGELFDRLINHPNNTLITRKMILEVIRREASLAEVRRRNND